MRSARITAALFVAAWAGSPATSSAVFSTTAGYSYSGVARAHPDDLNQFFRGDHTTVKVSPAFETNTDGKEFLAIATATHGVTEANGSLRASATFGLLRAKVDVTLTANGLLISPGESSASLDVLFATATAGWRDSITVTDSDLPIGAPLSVMGSMKVGGTLLTSTSGLAAHAEASVTLKDSGGGVFIDLGSVSNSPAQPGDGSDNPNVTLAVPMLTLNGIRRDIGYTLTVRGKGGARQGHTSTGTSTSIFTSDYTDTIRWGGITSVTVVDTGEPVDDWTVESESGFDYSRPAPVPEPASMLLLAPSLAALLWQVRRRRRTAGPTLNATGILPVGSANKRPRITVSTL